MNLNFGYVSLYGMSISLTEICMILMGIFSVMIYLSFKLD
jgi:phosphotransferase system  glucose/maltose/N-acetylglucosamine-specific IIC component